MTEPLPAPLVIPVHPSSADGPANQKKDDAPKESSIVQKEPVMALIPPSNVDPTHIASVEPNLAKHKISDSSLNEETEAMPAKQMVIEHQEAVPSIVVVVDKKDESPQNPCLAPVVQLDTKSRNESPASAAAAAPTAVAAPAADAAAAAMVIEGQPDVVVMPLPVVARIHKEHGVDAPSPVVVSRIHKEHGADAPPTPELAPALAAPAARSRIVRASAAAAAATNAQSKDAFHASGQFNQLARQTANARIVQRMSAVSEDVVIKSTSPIIRKSSVTPLTVQSKQLSEEHVTPSLPSSSSSSPSSKQSSTTITPLSPERIAHILSACSFSSSVQRRQRTVPGQRVNTVASVSVSNAMHNLCHDAAGDGPLRMIPQWVTTTTSSYPNCCLLPAGKYTVYLSPGIAAHLIEPKKQTATILSTKLSPLPGATTAAILGWHCVVPDANNDDTAGVFVLACEWVAGASPTRNSFCVVQRCMT